MSTPETVDFLAGTGMAFSGSSWILGNLSLSVNKNIYLNNSTGATMTIIGPFHCEMYLK